MKRVLVVMVFVAAVSTLMLAGCASKTSKAEFGFDEGQATVEGKTLTVALNADPDAGLDWVFTNQSDSILLKETSYQANEANNSGSSESGSASNSSNNASDDNVIDEEIQVGSSSATYGGVQTFVIEGTTAGDATFTLEYKQQNASSASIAYSFKVSTDNDGTIKSVEVSKGGEVVGGAIIA